MRVGYRVRTAANLVNGATLLGAMIALAGRARLTRGPDGLLIGDGYRLPVPVAPAFCVGGVIITKMDRESLASSGSLLAHEARHATQFAWCAGLPMLPLYFASAGISWLACGDFGAWNVFERRAGLADGGYTAKPLRPAISRLAQPDSSFAGRSRRRPPDSRT